MAKLPHTARRFQLRLASIIEDDKDRELNFKELCDADDAPIQSINQLIKINQSINQSMAGFVKRPLQSWTATLDSKYM